MMYSLFAQLAHLFDQAEPGQDPAQILMEDAGARAGQSPHQALELRQAAQALLSVVR